MIDVESIQAEREIGLYKEDLVERSSLFVASGSGVMINYEQAYWPLKDMPKTHEVSRRLPQPFSLALEARTELPSMERIWIILKCYATKEV
jgi:hypothetical protein